MSRVGKIQRITKETKITVNVDLDGEGIGKSSTGIGFFDHMLDLLCAHSLINLDINAEGDLHVDSHHTVEDVGIAFGQALSAALADKKSIKRFAHAYVPMDETLGFTCIDISGRPFIAFDTKFFSQMVGEFDTQMVEEFFRAVAVHAGLTLHIRVEHGSNDHHKIEAIFKSFARALKEAVSIDERVKGVPSTKGIL